MIHALIVATVGAVLIGETMDTIVMPIVKAVIGG